MQRWTISLAFLASFGSLAVGQTGPANATFALKILEEKCAACHGAARLSGLDVRQRDTLLQGGKRGPAVNPGHAEQSLLYQAASHQGELKMPPGSKTPLAAEELAILQEWINAGAPWPAGQMATRAQPSPELTLIGLHRW